MCCQAVSKILPAVFFFHITDFDFRSLHVRVQRSKEKNSGFNRFLGYGLMTANVTKTLK